MHLARLVNVQLSKPVRAAVVLAGVSVYILLYTVLRPHISIIAFPLHILPVIVAGWAFGLWGAVAMSIISQPLNLALLHSQGLPPYGIAQQAVFYITALITGLLVGYLFDTSRRLKHQLEQREIQAKHTQEEHNFIDKVNEITGVLNESLNLDDVLDHILEGLQHVAPHGAARIFLADNQDIKLARHTGVYVSKTGHFMDGISEISKRLHNNTATIVDPVKLRNSEIRSVIMAPVIIENMTLGFIILYSEQTGIYLPEHARRLQVIANHAALAIHNAQMYTVLESTVIELNTLYQATTFLLDANNMAETAAKIVEGVVMYFEKTDCGVMLLDEATGKITRLARAGKYNVATTAPLTFDGPGLVAEAIRTGEVIYVPDVTQDSRYVSNVPETMSELVIPLKGRTRVLGALDLQSPEPEAFTISDQRILTVFAERAAIAVDNMRLYDTIHDFALDREQQVIERTAELNRAKERVEIILNSSSDTIIHTMADGSIEQSNRAFYEMFGYEIDEEFGWPLSWLVVEEYQETVNTMVREARDTRRPRRMEVTAIRKDVSDFAADLVISPIYGRDGVCQGMVCSLRDMTERKRMERELREALEKERELRELKSRFISMASHEFRTPLATILATATLLHNYYDRMDETKRQHQFEKIEDQINYMTGLLEDVLSISRMEAGKTPMNCEMMSLQEFLEDITEEFEQTQPAHRLQFTWTGVPVDILLDPKLIREIVNNLLSNAAKYSQEGSTVYLELDYGPDEVIMRVRDEGIGIPESDQARLFEAFHRAENVGTRPGTGLGLSIVKNAVELHGGTITFNSKANEGTTFTVTIPVESEKGVVA